MKCAVKAIFALEVWSLIFLGSITILTFISLFCICVQPKELNSFTFEVPLVPFLPALSILLNIYLMLQLDPLTWMRLIAWILIGELQ